MPAQVLMPQLGESVVEGTVAKWLIAEGQPVTDGEPLLQITTDKVDTDIPAPASGILLRIHVAEGQTVAKGTVLALIGEADETIIGRDDHRSGGGDRPSATPLARRLAAERHVDLATLTGSGRGGRITREDVEAHGAAQTVRPSGPGFISPAVARLAGELNVDLAQVTGSGANGRITKKDVMAYVATPEGESPAVREDGEIVPLSSMRRSIAHHMTASVQAAPHVTTVMEADMTRVVTARERLRGEFERQGVKLTFSPFFIQAIIAGIKAVPEANSSFRDDTLLLHKRIHIGVAVAVPDGLIVPVIRDTDEKSLLGLARAVKDLADRARNKQLAPEDVQGGTFTLTNHGTTGSLFATPIIVQPQAGILGVGAIQKRPVVIRGGHPLLPDAEDAFAIRPMVYLSLTFDHRVLDGQSADSFLAAVKRFLEGYSG